MRVPDGFMQFLYLRNLTSSKSYLAHLQEQITTQNKVNRPSDNPLSNARIMRLRQQINSNDAFAYNINNGLSMIEHSITSMESIQSEVKKVMVDLTSMNNATVDEDLNSFASDIDAALKSILDLANSEYNNQYSFGGTDYSTKPFSFNNDNTAVVANSDNIGGDQKIRLNNNVFQKINISGKDLFMPVLNQSGNLDSTLAVGSVQTNSSTAYDGDGNEYTVKVDYKKTADNTYDLTYTITAPDSNVVSTNTVNNLKFDSTTGKLISADGKDPKDIYVSLPDNKFNLVIDFNNLTEKADTTNFVTSLSQKADIFNTLLSIKNKLLNGEKPNQTQMQIVDDFNQHVLNQLSEAGNISNRLNSSLDLLQNQKFELVNLLSSENDVDMAKALTDLESAQFSLDAGYKISSMILPRSLLDYL